MTLLPPEAPGPNPGQPGHFAHTDWLTASVKALDAGHQDQASDVSDLLSHAGDSPPAFGVTVPLGSGWAGSLSLDYRGGWVFLYGNPGKATWAGGEAVATVPAEYRRTGTTYAVGVGNATGNPVALYLDAAGALRVSLASSTEGSIGIAMTWPLQ